jgi:hypothetical protein
MSACCCSAGDLILLRLPWWPVLLPLPLPLPLLLPLLLLVEGAYDEEPSEVSLATAAARLPAPGRPLLRDAAGMSSREEGAPGLLRRLSSSLRMTARRRLLRGCCRWRRCCCAGLSSLLLATGAAPGLRLALPWPSRRTGLAPALLVLQLLSRTGLLLRGDLLTLTQLAPASSTAKKGCFVLVLNQGVYGSEMSGGGTHCMPWGVASGVGAAQKGRSSCAGRVGVAPPALPGAAGELRPAAAAPGAGLPASAAGRMRSRCIMCCRSAAAPCCGLRPPPAAWPRSPPLLATVAASTSPPPASAPLPLLLGLAELRSDSAEVWDGAGDGSGGLPAGDPTNSCRGASSSWSAACCTSRGLLALLPPLLLLVLRGEASAADFGRHRGLTERLKVSGGDAGLVELCMVAKPLGQQGAGRAGVTALAMQCLACSVATRCAPRAPVLPRSPLLARDAGGKRR